MFHVFIILIEICLDENAAILEILSPENLPWKKFFHHIRPHTECATEGTLCGLILKPQDFVTRCTSMQMFVFYKFPYVYYTVSIRFIV